MTATEGSSEAGDAESTVGEAVDEAAASDRRRRLRRAARRRRSPGRRRARDRRRASSRATAPASSTPEAARARSRRRSRRRAEHEPLAYILGREAFRELEIAVDARVLIPRRETELLVEVGAELPEGARVHEIGTGSGRDRPGPAQRAARPAGHRLRPLAGGGRSRARERRAARHRPRGHRRGGPARRAVEQEIDLVLANLPYVTDSTIFERSPEIQREPRIAVTGDCGEDGLGVIRGVLAEIPSGWRVALRARHPPRPGDARAAARRDYPSRLHGRRAGHGRLRSLSRRAMSDARASRRPLGAARPRRERRGQGRAAARGRDRSLPALLPRPRPDRGDPRRPRPRASWARASTSEFSYRIAGRVTGQRGHGKTAFFDVRDITGTIQAYARRRRARRGGVRADRGPRHRRHRRRRGRPLRDQARPAGDRRCASATLLAKALRDPPDLFHGISDPETRYRQRELDLMANERSREVFKMRAKVLAAIREHMNERGFVELETPILQRLTGGAAARPFNTHHHALDRHLFLRIATELYLKRAIVGGFEDVYELGKFFRNEGMSPQHNPEFTMLEWFVSGADYNGVMDFAEELVAERRRAGDGDDEGRARRRGRSTSRRPGSGSRLRDALLRGDRRRHLPRRAATSWPSWPATTPSPTTTGPALVDTLQGKLVEPKLIQPTFIDRPAARHLAAGQAVHAEHPQHARRGLRRDRRRDGDRRRRHRHQRPGRAARAASSNSASGRSPGPRRTRTSTTRSSCGRSNTGC